MADSGTKYTIMFVDDDQVLRGGVELALGPKFRFLWAERPEEAIALMREEKIDLAILDLRFRNSGITGYELAQICRTRSKDMVILALSDQPQKIPDFFRGFFNDYVSKSVDSAPLSQIVQSWFWHSEISEEEEARRYRILEPLLPYLPIARPTRRTGRDGVEKIWAKTVTVQIFGEEKTLSETAITVYDRPGRQKAKNTICLPALDGCPMGCLFCATGKLEFRRRLTAREMLGLFLLGIDSYHCRECFEPDAAVFREIVANWCTIGDVSFNLEECCLAAGSIKALNQRGLNVRCIFTSACNAKNLLAFKSQWKRMQEMYFSLNATTEDLRAKIMPGSEGQSIQQLLDIVWNIGVESGIVPTVSYIVIPGKNDGIANAVRLAELMDRRPFRLKVMPYDNSAVRETSSLLRDVPSATDEETATFAKQAEDAGIEDVRVRTFSGQGIGGGCGSTNQLTGQ